MTKFLMFYNSEPFSSEYKFGSECISINKKKYENALDYLMNIDLQCLSKVEYSDPNIPYYAHTIILTFSAIDMDFDDDEYFELLDFLSHFSGMTVCRFGDGIKISLSSVLYT